MIEEWVRRELNQVNRVGEMKGQVEHNGEESEVESEVDFGAEVGVNRINKVLEVEVVHGGGEVEGGNENDGGCDKSGGCDESGKKEVQQININNVSLVKWQMWF